MRRREFLLSGSGGLAAAPALSQTPVDWGFPSHPDLLTNAAGTEYFFLGNGTMTAIVQSVAAAEAGSHCGLSLFSPERFARKFGSFLYTEWAGLSGTRLRVACEGQTHQPAPGLARVYWDDGRFPVVAIEWKAGSLTVLEKLWCPTEEPALYRSVTLTNAGAAAQSPVVTALLTPNRVFLGEAEPGPGGVTADGFFRLHLLCVSHAVGAGPVAQLRVPLSRIAPGASATCTVAYVCEYSGGCDDAAARIRRTPMPAARNKAEAAWDRAARLTTGHAGTDWLFLAAQRGIRAVVSRSGRMAGGTFQYPAEWVRDSCMVAVGAIMGGMPETGSAILEHHVRHSIRPDGRCGARPDDLYELDENGELLHSLWTHWAWTGSDGIIRANWPRIRAVADFVLEPVFGFPETGLVRNSREFWERKPLDGVLEGYELAYQVWNWAGLRKAAEMAVHLRDLEAVARWEKAADRMKQAILGHPRFALVHRGRFIKRRAATGEPQFVFKPPDPSMLPPGMPLRVEPVAYCDPDATMALPVVLGLVSPDDAVAAGTMQAIEELWNQRWQSGGYGRYHVTSEPDSPGPWPFATLFVLRAYLEMGQYEKFWRGWNWLLQVQGGRSGAWFEYYGPRPVPPLQGVGIVHWTWGEMLALLVHHMLGVRPRPDGVTIKPRLPAGIDRARADIRVHGHTLALSIERTAGNSTALVDGRSVPCPASGLVLERLPRDVSVQMKAG